MAEMLGLSDQEFKKKKKNYANVSNVKMKKKYNMPEYIK